MPKKKPQKPSRQEPPKSQPLVSAPESRMQKALRYTQYPRYALYVLGLVFVLLVWTNTPFPILNPENSPMPFNWIITYPPSSPNELDVLNSSMMILVVNVSASQAFADGNAITISAKGAEDAEFVDDVHDIWVGFYGAYWYPLLSNGYQVSPFGAVDLIPNGTDSRGQVWLIPSTPTNSSYMLLAGSDRDIAFRTEGKYPLSIYINYNNGSSPTKYTYEEFSIFIQSSIAIRQDKQNTVLVTIGIVAFFFAILDLLPKVTKKP